MSRRRSLAFEICSAISQRASAVSSSAGAGGFSSVPLNRRRILEIASWICPVFMVSSVFEFSGVRGATPTTGGGRRSPGVQATGVSAVRATDGLWLWPVTARRRAQRASLLGGDGYCPGPSGCVRLRASRGVVFPRVYLFWWFSGGSRSSLQPAGICSFCCFRHFSGAGFLAELRVQLMVPSAG